jgi:hypothetical protein
MDPNTVDQTPVAGYARRVALLFERHRGNGHYAHEHDHCQQHERMSARRRTRFDAGIDGHAHTLDEQRYWHVGIGVARQISPSSCAIEAG